MPLLNYTTEVPSSKSISEIMRLLQEGGATHIGIENGSDRQIVAISFRMDTAFGPLMFELPAKIDEVMATIAAQIEAENPRARARSNYRRKIPLSMKGDRAAAERIAWRIAKDWLEAQLAMVEIGNAKIEQIMLPFATVNGKSFYQRLLARGTLALPAPKEEKPADVEV